MSTKVPECFQCPRWWPGSEMTRMNQGVCLRLEGKLTPTPASLGERRRGSRRKASGADAGSSHFKRAAGWVDTAHRRSRWRKEQDWSAEGPPESLHPDCVLASPTLSFNPCLIKQVLQESLLYGWGNGGSETCSRNNQYSELVGMRSGGQCGEWRGRLERRWR